MQDFLDFFNSILLFFPMRLEIGYNKVADWGIVVWGQGCGEDGSDVRILSVEGGDVKLVFAKAQVELKEWLLEHNGGY